MEPSSNLCHLCNDSMGAEQGAIHQACADEAQIAENDRRCRRCGRDSYYCPCTTGWSSTGGMGW